MRPTYNETKAVSRAGRSQEEIMGRICCERMAVLSGFCCEHRAILEIATPYPGGQFIGRPPST